MRAFDIALFIILLEATIGFSNALGIWEENYYQAPNNTYTNYKVADLNTYNNATVVSEPALIDRFVKGASDLIGSIAVGLWGLFTIIFSIIYIYPELIKLFGIPSALGTFMQVGIYVIYLVGLYQWKSNKGVDNYR